MQYRELKPFVQDSFGFNFPEPEDVVIPAKDTRQGILFFQSLIPSFKQTGAPVTVSREKIYQRAGKQPFKVIYNTLHFPGEYVDEYAETIAYCPCCHQKLVENGVIINELRHIPFGGTYTTLDVSRRRLRCLNPKCRYHYDCPIEFKAPGHLITVQLLAYTQDLLAMHLQLKTIAHITGLNQNTVKEIDRERLNSLYTVNGEGKVLKTPEKRSRVLAIDEFKLHDGHTYATVIIDLETGHILHLEHGKKKASVYEFIDRVGLDWMSSVQAVACNMNSDFEEAFLERCPHLHIVYDFFHIKNQKNAGKPASI